MWVFFGTRARLIIRVNLTQFISQCRPVASGHSLELLICESAEHSGVWAWSPQGEVRELLDPDRTFLMVPVLPIKMAPDRAMLEAMLSFRGTLPGALAPAGSIGGGPTEEALSW